MWPFSQRAVTREDVARWLASGRAKPIAKAIENGGDEDVRREAASALASMAAADLGQAGRSKVVDLLGGPEGDVRQAALLGAASQPQAYNVEPLFQAIEAAGEPDRDAAYDQLGKFLFTWAQLRRDFGDDLDEVAVRMAPIVRATNGNETAYDPLLSVTCKAANRDRGQNPVIDHAIRLAALGNAFVNHAIRSGNYDRLRPALRRVGILSYQDPMLEERQRLIDSMVEMLRESEGDIREKVATVIIAIFAGAEPTIAWKNL